MNARPCRKAKQKVLNNFRNQVTYNKRGQQRLDTTLQDCAICLEKVAIRGILSVCEHWFCFICIYEWSKNTNTCPLCKSRFRCITKRSYESFETPDNVFRIKDKDQSIVTYHEDDYEVAMGLENEESPSSSDTDIMDNNDETFIPSSENSTILGRRRCHPLRTRQPRVCSQQRLVADEDSSTGTPSTSQYDESSPVINSQVASPLVVVDALSSVEKTDSRKPSIAKKRKKRKSIRFQGRRRRKPNDNKSSSNGWIDMSRKVIVPEKDIVKDSSSDEDVNELGDTDSSSDDDFDTERVLSRRPELRRIAKVKGMRRIKRSDNCSSRFDYELDSENSISSRLRKRSAPKTNRYKLNDFLESGSSDGDMGCEEITSPLSNAKEKASLSPVSPILFSTGGMSVDVDTQPNDGVLDQKTRRFRSINHDDSLLLSEISPCVLSQRPPIPSSSYRQTIRSNKENIGFQTPSTSKRPQFTTSRRKAPLTTLDNSSSTAMSCNRRYHLDLTSNKNTTKWQSDRQSCEVSLHNEMQSPKTKNILGRFNWRR